MSWDARGVQGEGRSRRPGAGFEPALVGEIEEALQLLTPREQEILRLRFGIGDRVHEIDEVSDRIGVTRRRALQIEQRALGNLRLHAMRIAAVATMVPPTGGIARREMRALVEPHAARRMRA